MRAVVLLLALGAAGLAYLAALNPAWALEFLGLGLLYGSAAVYIASRRVYYVAAVAPHSSLMAIGAAELAGLATGLAKLAATTLLGATPVGLALALIAWGVPEYFVASVLTALTASVGVLAIAISGGEGHVEALTGRALEASLPEAALVAALGLASAALVRAWYWVYVYAGVDPDAARLSTVKWRMLAEAAGVAVVVVSTAGMVWYTGFVIQHVLLLLPPLVAVRLASSAREALNLAYSSAIAASTLGAAIGVSLGLPPSGAIGVVGAIMVAATLRPVRSGLERLGEAQLH